MTWRTLDFLDFKGRISYRRAHLVVHTVEGEEHTVNLNDIGLILLSSGVTMSGGLLVKCAQMGISVQVCDWRGIPEGALHSWSTHTRVGARQLAQAGLSLPRRKAAWANIIRSKIRGQASVAALTDRKVSQKLLDHARLVKSGDSDNREGVAAKLYWSHFGTTGITRASGIGVDNANSLLDYGYTLLRGHGIRAVAEAGLWPALGVFHRGRSNAFNLVDDLIEPFRPIVDEVVLSQEADATLTDPLVKRRFVESLGASFGEQGYSTTTVLKDLARSFGQYVEGDRSTFEVPVWSSKLQAV